MLTFPIFRSARVMRLNYRYPIICQCVWRNLVRPDTAYSNNMNAQCLRSIRFVVQSVLYPALIVRKRLLYRPTPISKYSVLQDL